ncbi:MAG: cytochrome c biogenesis protein CcdA [Candidatus Omnitrophica bacterium]|nr:cytochrome c biogenesis protein CcdA [Candidatus Omnitrophota bacterium]MDD5429241.1 cytochrome c biogenesis protein CcdA [Candidatus Omnitrophota bacterium]
MLEHLLASLESIFISSPFLGLGVSFLAGVLVSFSPCIYPLIPITLSVVGAEAATTKLKSFSISLVFVLGIASVYTLLGIISSAAGLLLGSFFINPVTYAILASIFFFLGFSLLSGININIPFFSFNYDSSRNKEFISVFLLGAVSALAIIPCNFPVLGAILSVISLRKNIFYGAVALFFFSIGYGTILIILGTFTALIRKLPKQGQWLIILKRILGIMLMFVGVYFFWKLIDILA